MDNRHLPVGCSTLTLSDVTSKSITLDPTTQLSGVQHSLTEYGSYSSPVPSVWRCQVVPVPGEILPQHQYNNSDSLSLVRPVFSLRADAVAGHNTTVIMKVTVKSPDTRTCPNNREGCNNEHAHSVLRLTTQLYWCHLVY